MINVFKIKVTQSQRNDKDSARVKIRYCTYRVASRKRTTESILNNLTREEEMLTSMAIISAKAKYLRCKFTTKQIRCA